jgi:hypothetical protein
VLGSGDPGRALRLRHQLRRRHDLELRGRKGGSLELLEAVAASTSLGQPGVRDEAISRNGRFLYAIDADAQRVFGWTIDDDGGLTLVGEFEGVPETVAGPAAS